ncbi:hypothetical protein Tco_0798582 [Tanacetum coccineum]
MCGLGFRRGENFFTMLPDCVFASNPTPSEMHGEMSHASRFDESSQVEKKKYLWSEVVSEGVKSKFLVMKFDGCYEDVSIHKSSRCVVSNAWIELQGCNLIPTLEEILLKMGDSSRWGWLIARCESTDEQRSVFEEELLCLDKVEKCRIVLCSGE